MKSYAKFCCIVAILMLFCFQNLSLSAFADVKIKSLGKPLYLVIEHDLKAEDINVGRYVSFVVPEAINYKNSTIPTGARIKGQIIAIKKSGRYNQYGYFKLQLTEISVPDSKWVSTFDLLQEPVYLKVYEKDIQEYKLTKDGRLEVGKFLAGTALGIVVPGGGTAIKGIDCIRKEFKRDKNHERTKTRKVAQGLCEATNIPSVIRFFQKNKSPDYKQGQLVMMKLNKDLFNSFFDLHEQTKAHKPEL